MFRTPRPPPGKCMRPLPAFSQLRTPYAQNHSIIAGGCGALAAELSLLGSLQYLSLEEAPEAAGDFPERSCWMILTPALAPIRVAPASTIFCRSSRVRTPPAALMPVFGPTVSRIRRTSSGVAPAVLKPVEVFTKSATAFLAASEAWIFSSRVSRQVSMITLQMAPPWWLAFTTPWISASTAASRPDFSAPKLMTMSISWAPRSMDFCASKTFTSGSVAPRGKPTTVQTFTSLPRRISAACPTFQGFTHTEAKWYCMASAQSLAISFCVASGLSRVWSIRRANSDSVGGMVIRLFRRKSEDADVFQIAITFGVVEAVADDEIVGDLKTDVIGFDLLDAARGLIEERGDAQGFGLALFENAQQVGQGDAGVEYVFDHDHVQTFDAAIEIFQQADLTGTFFVFAVAGDRDEVYGSFQVDFADQVGEEDAGAF